MASLEFVELGAARAARGVRMVVASSLPSPWSEATKALFRLKEIPALGVRFQRSTAEVEGWTRTNNVPVVFHDDEPPRAGWAPIIALAERLAPERAPVPTDADERARMFGLVHELAGEGGLGWSERLIMIDGSFTSDGARGFPLSVAHSLAPKYGYGPARVSPARARVVEVLALFDRALARAAAAGHHYLFGAQPTAADVYLATFLTPIVNVTEAECPAMRAPVRPAFTYLNGEVGAHVTPALAAHRRMMFDHHFGWPIVL